jgi:catechol 2,3-dioxygenase-like lactoylglutathione lyase family enzyme
VAFDLELLAMRETTHRPRRRRPAMLLDVTPQLRTTDLGASVRLYSEVLGFSVEFNYEDFYVGLRTDGHVLHLKRVDARDPSIDRVDEEGHFHLYLRVDDVAAFAARLQAKGIALVRELHQTAWRTRALVLHDDQGHTIYVGQAL